jgi:hypothetical protein
MDLVQPFIINSTGKMVPTGETMNNMTIETGLEVCAPRKIDLPLKNNEKIIKIYANFDRNAVITGTRNLDLTILLDQGNCYVWGGESSEEIGKITYIRFRI